ncbi:hypothetical protein [Gordonia malaquae]|uniref:hypothetical protein n=1 Tax=Gordonia malaquae TaxID=410332 RepID=UPI003015F354
MSTTYSTVSELAAAVDEHFRRSDMPVFAVCSRTPGGYTFAEPDQGQVPYVVTEPDGYQGADGLYYWGPSTKFTDPLVFDGYILKSMHSSEHPTPGFIEGHLDDIDDGPITLGCVVVSFGGDEEPEWAWVTAG